MSVRDAVLGESGVGHATAGGAVNSEIASEDTSKHATDTTRADFTNTSLNLV